MKSSGPYAVVAARNTSPHEQRRRPRHPLQLDVDLVHPEGRSCPGRTTNIGFGGMFVRAPSNRLQSNDVVSAFITIGSRRCHVPALVMRVTPEGVGLMFARFDRDTLDLLGPLLTAQSPRAEEHAAPKKRAASN